MLSLHLQSDHSDFDCSLANAVSIDKAPTNRNSLDAIEWVYGEVVDTLESAKMHAAVALVEEGQVLQEADEENDEDDDSNGECIEL